ncbi:MAG: FecR domain-containing protein [Gemmatimonadota bacterium]
MDPRSPDRDETSRQVADARVDELIVRALEGVATASERALLASWLGSSPERQRRHDETARLWRLTAMERARVTRRVAVPDRVRNRLQLQPVEHVEGRPRGRTTSRLFAAAAIALLMLGAGTAWKLTRPPDEGTMIAEYRTRTNQAATALLEDGSVVYLGPRSHLRILRGSSRHELHLQGRAYFSVANHPGRRFVVHTANGTVRAAATRFEVVAEQNVTRVLVIDGEATLEATRGGGSASVTSGRMVRAQETAMVADTVRDISPELSWMRGVLIFRDTPLREVALEIEREYGERVIVAESLGDRLVTAWFDQDDVTEILSVICRATFTRLERQDGVARIVPTDQKFMPQLKNAGSE